MMSWIPTYAPSHIDPCLRRPSSPAEAFNKPLFKAFSFGLGFYKLFLALHALRDHMSMIQRQSLHLR